MEIRRPLKPHLASLAKIVLMAGATIWPQGTLAAYMAYQLVRHPANIWWRLNEHGYRRLSYHLLFAAGVVLFGLALMLASALSSMTLAFSSMLAFMAFSWVIEYVPARGPAQWNNYALNHDGFYLSIETRKKASVPPFVFMLMQRIIALKPDVEFRIEVLERDGYPLDPVVYVIDEDERCIPIEVYDEGGRKVFPPDQH